MPGACIAGPEVVVVTAGQLDDIFVALGDVVVAVAVDEMGREVIVVAADQSRSHAPGFPSQKLSQHYFPAGYDFQVPLCYLANSFHARCMQLARRERRRRFRKN